MLAWWAGGGIGLALVVGYVLGRIHRHVRRRLKVTFVIEREGEDDIGSDPATSDRIKHVPFEEDEHE